MIDKLKPRKRIKYDFMKIIKMLGLVEDFLHYGFEKHRSISFRRLARSYLSHKHVNVFGCYCYLKDKPYADFTIALKDHNGDLSIFYE